MSGGLATYCAHQSLTGQEISLEATKEGVSPTNNAAGVAVEAHGCGDKDAALLVERTLVSVNNTFW